ncbi:TraB/GumN family protein [Phenylobacterium sp.]|uniref:TraB/GumN family protein n=1 Tax=Phenylobacterium sp. TaxID=1871053 RepID=UPI00273110D1|nr:TraB/GumN family protein [Phenylobacterium sp.]MDP1615911.1 TraB/GumN family protein [Phenylobacterium sp.]MDP1987460.1 TraB/GumN family protein [Phenylobacterium sp.]
MTRLLGLLALLIALGACAPQPARAEPAMWIVRDADSEMVLFGSMHLLPPGLPWRPKALDDALARADDLWFELPVDPETEAQAAQLAMRYGALPPGQSLYDQLPPESRERLTRLAALHRLPPNLLDRLKPWFAEVLLASAAFAAAGADVEQGVEKQVSLTAPPGLERRALESAEQQIALFDAVPIDEQWANLIDTLEQLEDDPQGFDRLIAAWMSGDLDALEAEALDPMREAAPGLYRSMVVDRNTAWLELLEARLEGAGRSVVVVGAGHLLGQDGLPERLRALGYEVEGP